MSLVDLLVEHEDLAVASKRVSKKIGAEIKRIEREPKPKSKKSKDAFFDLSTENRKLRGMIAVLYKESRLTYKELGLKIGCSAGRAQQIVARQINELKMLDDKE